MQVFLYNIFKLRAQNLSVSKTTTAKKRTDNLLVMTKQQTGEVMNSVEGQDLPPFLNQ